MPEVRNLVRRAKSRKQREDLAKEKKEAAADGDLDSVSTPSVEPASGPDRHGLAVKLLKPNRSQVIMAVVLFITAFLTVTGIKARGAGEDFSTLRRSELIQMLDTLNADSRSLEAEIGKLSRVKEQLQSGADSAEVAESESRRRLDEMKILSGTAPAVGPGVRITIFDPKGKVGPELLLDAVEEMRDAGAEVISVNEKTRIVASSWFGRSDDGSLVVDGTVITKPIMIEAIGDPGTLEAGAKFRGGLASEVQNERVGGSVSIAQVSKLEIRAVTAASVPQFSRPA